MNEMHLAQRLLGRWSNLVFGSIKITPRIRAMRLLEEAYELAQAEGVSELECVIIRDQVYGKPAGEPRKELGGVLTTAFAYADCADFDSSDAFWTEFERIMDPAMMEKVRHRNLAGDKIGFKKEEINAR